MTNVNRANYDQPEPEGNPLPWDDIDTAAMPADQVVGALEARLREDIENIGRDETEHNGVKSVEVYDRAYECKVLADSVSPEGARLTTMEVTFPRIILAEMNTHRVFSRNSASSRAIPIKKRIEMVKKHPYVPEYWGKLQKGMAADEQIDRELRQQAKETWLDARDHAVKYAEELAILGIHKQTVSRLLEPFLWQVAIISSTEWENFFRLRTSPAAQPEMRAIAELMQEAHEISVPNEVEPGEWHLPLVKYKEKQEIPPEDQPWVSAGRCARVSYMKQEDERDWHKDRDLCQNIAKMGHCSPLEHVATPLEDASEWSGNFRGWKQLRKTMPEPDQEEGAEA